MAERLRAHLPRIGALVLAGLALSAGLTYAAGRQIGSPTPAATTPAPQPPLVVPDVKGQAFVFAKGSLEDAGFAWHVVGSVHGYAANTVLTQSPAPGTRVLNTGAPLITLTLKRNSVYPQNGAAEDLSPYQASVLQPADLAAAVGPEHTATTTTKTQTTPKPATTTTTPAATKTVAPKTAAPKQTSKWPQNRPPAFVVPGARKEPLDEMPLTNRAQLLLTWLNGHPRKSNGNVKRWLYQNEWIVTGAKLGWWHGAAALTTLIAADRRAQQLWGIGSKSAAVAQSALSEVESKSK